MSFAGAEACTWSQGHKIMSRQRTARNVLEDPRGQANDVSSRTPSLHAHRCAANRVYGDKLSAASVIAGVALARAKDGAEAAVTWSIDHGGRARALGHHRWQLLIVFGNVCCRTNTVAGARDVMGNQLCAPWRKGYREDEHQWTPRKDSHLLRYVITFDQKCFLDHSSIISVNVYKL